MPKKKTQSTMTKNFCFTANGRVQTWEEIVEKVEESKRIKYICAGAETASTGTIHWQGFCQTIEKSRFSAMQKLFSADNTKKTTWCWHWENRHKESTNQQARDYCFKECTEELLNEWGVFNVGVQGKRTDIHGTAEIILAGGTKDEVIQGGGAAQMIKHRGGILGLIADVLEAKLPNYMPVSVHFYWGEQTGGGKTWAATNFDEDKPWLLGLHC